MALQILPTTFKISSPIFLSKSSLEELDAIMDSIRDDLSLSQENLIEDKIKAIVDERKKKFLKLHFNPPSESRIERWEREAKSEITKYDFDLRNIKRKLSVTDENGNTINGSSFAEFQRDPTTSNLNINRFTYELDVGRFSAKVSLDSRYSSLPPLEISVHSPNQDEANVAYQSLCDWGEKQIPGMYLRLALWLNDSRGIVFFMSLIFSLFVYMALSEMKTDYKEIQKQELRTLLKEGINAQPEKKDRAIEILLAMESGYIPSDVVIAKPRINPVPFILPLAFILIFMRCPNVIVGVGGGREKLSRWKTWLSVVKFLVPASIVAYFWICFL